MKTMPRLIVLFAVAAVWVYGDSKATKNVPPAAVPKPSAIDKILEDLRNNPARPAGSPGSTFDPLGKFADLSRDLRASRVNDLLTVAIADHSSATSTGNTTAKRASSLSANITALAGLTKTTGPLANLAGLAGATNLAGQGATGRTSDLTMNLTARVIGVLPNGTLIIEGNKLVQINSEKQTVTLRALVRWDDIDPTNTISSDRLAELEIKVDGRGAVNDAIRRPNFLYRLLSGILPF